MRIFLIINLLIVIINSIEYRINNNCAWPDDCYITMKFTKTCAIESATVEKAKINKLTEKEVKEMDDKKNFHCFGYPKESSIRCYNRCYNIPMNAKVEIPENHMYQYTSDTFKEKLQNYKTLNSTSDRITRIRGFGWVTVENKDKQEEYLFWQDCVSKGLTNSTSIQTNIESKSPIKVSLKCEKHNSFCQYVIEYTLDGIKSITSEEKTIGSSKSAFYSQNVYSCRIYENAVKCMCLIKNVLCRSFDHLIETIYLLGRDDRIRGEYMEIADQNQTEHHENIPKVLEMLQTFRTNYPKNIYGSINLDCKRYNDPCQGYCAQEFRIDENCYNFTKYSSAQGFIFPHRFVDTENAGSIALEVALKGTRLHVKVYCRMGCIVDDALYASILDVLNRQMETKDDIILFTSYNNIENKEKEEYFACAYYSFRNTILKSMYGTYDIPTEQPQTIRKIRRPYKNLSLIISTLLASIIMILIILTILIGTISYFRSQTKKEPITFSKKTVIAPRKKPTRKSSELLNSKDKSGDFYDCVSKTTSTFFLKFDRWCLDKFCHF